MKKDDSYWWYITVSADDDQEEILFSIADISGSIGTELQELPLGGIKLRMYYRSSEDLHVWKARLIDAIKDWISIKIVDFGKIENQPWNVASQEAFPPLPVGKTMVVLAPWHKGTEPEGLMPLYINPGSAFGTGYHESTQIVLELMEEFVKPGMTTADIGTGSGILTICAVKLGAEKAYARDIDPAVIEEVNRNYELNGLNPAKIDLATGDLLNGFKHKVNILTANILLDPLTTMLDQVPRVIGREGMAIFSGMLVTEREIFIPALEKAGMKVVRELEKGDWWGVAAKTAS